MPAINQKQKITPFLWFDGKAEEAIKLYTSVFKKLQDRKHFLLGRRKPFPQRPGNELHF